MEDAAACAFAWDIHRQNLARFESKFPSLSTDTLHFP
jgi:hypothetical protein